MCTKEIHFTLYQCFNIMTARVSTLIYISYFRTMLFMILFSQYLKNIKIPFPVYRRTGLNKGWGIVQINLIQLFPVSNIHNIIVTKNFILNYYLSLTILISFKYTVFNIIGIINYCCNVGFMWSSDLNGRIQ